jgi:sulfur carrier protein ThiS
MVVFLKADGRLAAYLKMDEKTQTHRLELDRPHTLAEILSDLGIPSGLVAFGYSDGQVRRMDYEPADGETITLQPPVSGG